MHRDLLERLKSLRLLEEDNDGGTGGADSKNDPPEPPKTFTQEDLNRIAAQEKRQGQSSILKALGFESEEDAKKYLDAKRKEDDEKKDDLQKAQEAEQAAQAAKKAAEAQAELLEKKYKVIAMGVPANNVDDIVVLANAKVTDKHSFEDALESIKKSYPALFTEGSNSGGGTGGSGNPPRGGKKETESMGKRLAEKRKSSVVKDDTYFTR